MKKYSCVFIGIFLLIMGCQSSSNTVWEDTKTMGRYLHRKGQLLWKQDVDSRMVESTDDFVGPQEDEYIALEDEDLKTQFADFAIPQAKEVPGSAGSSIPSIDHFVQPTALLANLFKTIHFNTDEHILRSKESYQVVFNIAEYMKKHPDLYLFISGHCDERGSEGYNLALGSRRSNAIRHLLVEKGVNSNNIYTVSCGKEMPKALGHSPEDWAQNRRVEFKIYEKKVVK